MRSDLDKSIDRLEHVIKSVKDSEVKAKQYYDFYYAIREALKKNDRKINIVLEHDPCSHTITTTIDGNKMIHRERSLGEAIPSITKHLDQ